MKRYPTAWEAIDSGLARVYLDQLSGLNPATCWDWTGDTSASGYGVLTLGGRRFLAHRLALVFAQRGEELECGPVRHLCGNKLCCNHAHLDVPGTSGETRLRVARQAARAHSALLAIQQRVRPR